MTEALSYGPILVNEGEVNELIGEHQLRNAMFRTAVGMVEPGHYIVIVPTQKTTLADLAQMFVDRGCVNAYNLKGGDYAAMFFMGDQINHSRFVPEWTASPEPLMDMLMFGVSSIVAAS